MDRTPNEVIALTKLTEKMYFFEEKNKKKRFKSEKLHEKCC